VRSVSRVVISLFVCACIVVPAARALAAPPQQPPSSQASAEEVIPPYYVSQGDILKIAVWKEPELTTEVFVRLDGMVTVPLAGDIRAAGKTTEQIATEVRTKLRAFLEVPQVTVTVAQATSARFYVIGEVTTSGSFPLTGRITVLQALALAGGFREFAKKGQVVVIRDRRGEPRAIKFDFNDVAAGNQLRQNIALEAGDTLIVP
jgi:polysaccharide export outer membrane protein